MRVCPMCAEEIQPTAKKCKHCGELLDPGLRSQTASNQFRQLAILLMVFAVLAVIWVTIGNVQNG